MKLRLKKKHQKTCYLQKKKKIEEEYNYIIYIRVIMDVYIKNNH